MFERVVRGAAHLDQVRPGWANEINLLTLDIGSYGGCVLGQLWGDYGEGVRESGLADVNREAYGFRNGHGSTADLNDAWWQAVIRRRK